MKTDIHPNNYRPVIFEDITGNKKFLVMSAVDTTEKDKWEDGQEYDLYKVEISSASHPFYTGQNIELDRAGRADKFRKRMAKAGKTAEPKVAKTKAAEAKEEAPAADEAADK